MNPKNLFLAFLAVLVFLTLTGCPPAQQPDPPADNDPVVEEPDTQTPDNTGTFGREGTLTPTDQVDGEVTSDTDNTAVDGAGGSTTTITEAGSLPEGWPEYIPVMEGLAVETSVINSSSNPTENALMVWVSGIVPPADITAFYENLEGWTIDVAANNSAQSTESYSMVVMTKGAEKLSVAATKDEDSGMITAVLTYYSGTGAV